MVPPTSFGPPHMCAVCVDFKDRGWQCDWIDSWPGRKNRQLSVLRIYAFCLFLLFVSDGNSETCITCAIDSRSDSISAKFWATKNLISLAKSLNLIQHKMSFWTFVPRTFLRVVAANKRVEWLIGGKCFFFQSVLVCLLVFLKPSDTILHALRLALFLSFSISLAHWLSKLRN